ncbi:MAG: rubredoxin [Deltaproteobacteria bacterium]|nr:rubredoxin [Deltaproteobacteria bacterium]
MDRYVCTVSENGVDPGTKFEDLPDDWTCPICDATKDQFEKE